MRKIITIILFACIAFSVLQAQDDSSLPYAEIPAYPEKYTAETVVARMIDGLGFRYYWGTDGLQSEDLNYKPVGDGRTINETLKHIYELSQIVVNATSNAANTGDEDTSFSFNEIRKLTLNNFKKASENLKLCKEGSLNDFRIIFKKGSSQSEYPFWNNINGPIEDALWHVGQVVTLRRMSGNPFNSKVSLFSGKLRE